jgi:hypothetical protein
MGLLVTALFKTNVMNRTAYVAGKITGLPIGEVIQKFNLISNELTDKGYNVVKPSVVTDSSKPWDDAVRNDIKHMLECDEVHLLPDWQDSRGAQLERDIAVRLGMQVVYH